MTVPKIKDVKPKKNNMLIVTFENGVKKLFDVTPYINDFKAFAPIKNEKLFNSVYVDSNGYSIAWNENIDIDRYDVWEFGAMA